MSQLFAAHAVEFPERVSTHLGSWAPLYMEPLVGSGEKICIGVAAADNNTAVVRIVDGLERFESVFGSPARAFSWAANLAILDAQHAIAQGGLQALTEWARGIDGLSVGEHRTGAGTNLSDVAEIALQQSSALIGADGELSVREDVASYKEESTGRLDAQVRRLVVSRRPLLRENFSRSFPLSQSSRLLRFGYVGKRIIANFAQLNARSTNVVSQHVDKAKARLWDLHQLNEGVLSDSFHFRNSQMTHELLVHRPSDASLQSTGDNPKRLRVALKDAEEELEAEADKREIRLRSMTSPLKIAAYLVEREEKAA